MDSYGSFKSRERQKLVLHYYYHYYQDFPTILVGRGPRSEDKRILCCYLWWADHHFVIIIFLRWLIRR